MYAYNRSRQDYMSLAVMTLTDTYQDPHPESRLMLEEDEPGEGDDEYACMRVRKKGSHSAEGHGR